MKQKRETFQHTYSRDGLNEKSFEKQVLEAKSKSFKCHYRSTVQKFGPPLIASYFALKE